MTALADFRASLGGDVPGSDDPALAGLWWAAKGEWERAHGCVQAHEGTPRCDWVHAHLHRLEGDAGNAAYWYRRAGRAVATGALNSEWDSIATELLGR